MRMARKSSEDLGLRAQDGLAEQHSGQEGFYSPPVSPVAAQGGGNEPGGGGVGSQRRMTYPAGKIYHLVPARLVFGEARLLCPLSPQEEIYFKVPTSLCGNTPATTG